MKTIIFWCALSLPIVATSAFGFLVGGSLLGAVMGALAGVMLMLFVVQERLVG